MQVPPDAENVGVEGPRPPAPSAPARVLTHHRLIVTSHETHDGCAAKRLPGLKRSHSKQELDLAVVLDSALQAGDACA